MLFVPDEWEVPAAKGNRCLVSQRWVLFERRTEEGCSLVNGGGGGGGYRVWGFVTQHLFLSVT